MEFRETARFQEALRRLDAGQATDPRQVIGPEGEMPAGLDHARRLFGWVEKLRPDAPEALLLAARGQHLRRWERPRSDYPEGRAGYHRWRTDAQKFHAELTADILREVGYEEALIDRVRALIRKQNLKTDPDTQTMEDGLCLVFLETGFADFAAKHERPKILDILRKTWGKMSPAGQAAALTLPLGPETLDLVREALTPSPEAEA